MAQTSTNNTKSETKTEAAPKPPAGFQRGGTPEIDGWYKPEKGHVFTGQIVGRIRIDGMDDDEERDVVLVKLAEPCKAVLAGDEPITLDAGQILAVGMRQQLNEMLLYVEHQGSCWIHAKNIKNLKKGRTMWEFDQFYKGKKAAPPAPISRTGGVDDGSVPNF